MGNLVGIPSIISRSGNEENPRYNEPFKPHVTLSDPEWIATNTESAVDGSYQRVKMTPELLTFLLWRFVEQEIMQSGHAWRLGTRPVLPPL
jgi:hypothetical protein